MASPSQKLAPAHVPDQQIVAETAHGLHEMAQPLAVLQGVLELALLKAHTVEDYRKACQRAIDELQRVNQHFDNVRKFLRSQRSSAESTSSCEKTGGCTP